MLASDYHYNLFAANCIVCVYATLSVCVYAYVGGS